MTDIEVQYYGSIFLLIPRSEAGSRWVSENVSEEGYQPSFPERVIVEPRYAGDIIQGALDAGLCLKAGG